MNSAVEFQSIVSRLRKKTNRKRNTRGFFQSNGHMEWERENQTAFMGRNGGPRAASEEGLLVNDIIVSLKAEAIVTWIVTLLNLF